MLFLSSGISIISRMTACEMHRGVVIFSSCDPLDSSVSGCDAEVESEETLEEDFP